MTRAEPLVFTGLCFALELFQGEFSALSLGILRQGLLSISLRRFINFSWSTMSSAWLMLSARICMHCSRIH